MSPLMKTLMKFAQSPQGRRLTNQALTYAAARRDAGGSSRPSAELRPANESRADPRGARRRRDREVRDARDM